MAVHLRWKLTDPYTGDVYTFYPNPNEMTSPFPTRSVQAKTVTSPAGQVIFTEGARTPAEWSFGGDILDPTQYEALRAWVYDRRGRRVVVSDHYGRRIICVLTQFDPTPKRAIGKYWRHTYTISALVVSVGAPTVGEVTP